MARAGIAAKRNQLLDRRKDCLVGVVGSKSGASMEDTLHLWTEVGSIGLVGRLLNETNCLRDSGRNHEIGGKRNSTRRYPQYQDGRRKRSLPRMEKMTKESRGA